MTDIEKLIERAFLEPFDGKDYGNVGVELEFPLINMEGGAVDENAAKGVFEYFLNDGFKVAIEEDGEIFFIENEDGDCLSFDNSYNNFEFSMSYGDDLCAIERRFQNLRKRAQKYFTERGHTLAGRGTNPNKKNIKQAHVNFSTYNMVDEYLHAFGKDTPYPDFPAYLSSAQTHLDIPRRDIPKAYSLFAKLDFARALLFSNSPDFDGKGYICYRDFLWEQSAFSLCPNITGKVDETFENEEDVIAYIAKKGIFNRLRNGKYEIFAPVTLKEYFKREDAREEDIECYLSFKNVEITRRGTLEIRSDCAQVRGYEFSPAAFNLGILYKMDEAEKCLDKFFEENNITGSNSYLRNEVIAGRSIADEKKTDAFLNSLWDIAKEGLETRGKGEERLLR